MSAAGGVNAVVDFQVDWAGLELPEPVREVLSTAPQVQTPETRQQLLDWALGRPSGATDWKQGNRDDKGEFEAAFEVPGVGRVVEAVVTKARNGLAVNFPEPAMRRRDPDAMVIGDDLPTDKPTYKERFGEAFDKTRQKTLDWLKGQELIVVPFYAGPDELGYGSLLIAPRQAAFFAAALADLQGMIPRQPGALPTSRSTAACSFVAPPFRHTHFRRQAGGGAFPQPTSPGDFCLQPLSRPQRQEGRLQCCWTSASARAGSPTIARRWAWSLPTTTTW